jgi:ATP-binding cassette subfamily B protein
VIIATAILISINWKLTLLAYLPLSLLSVLVKTIGRQIHERFERIQEQFSSLTTHVQENISGIRVVQAFSRESSQISDFEALNHEYVQGNLKLIRLSGIFFPLMSGLIGLSSVALLWFGGREVIAGRLSLGELVAFMGYLGMLSWPTIAIGWVINIFQRGAASMDRILRILEQEPAIRSAPAAWVPDRVRGEIEFRNLTFRYPGSEKPVLRNITIKLRAGETLALVGRTGSGKSTLISLLPRLHDPPPDSVFIDGQDVRHWDLATLRRSLGLVPQETFLYSDTVWENIAFGRKDPSEQEIMEVAQAAQVDGDIMEFPQKLRTRVGERGITLSGGQRQRIAISRALLVTSPILILDDSLSNVDTQTEERILERLTHWRQRCTAILVSHRISTIKNAHQIVVLEDGAIVEQGNHASLLAEQGLYASLYQKQLLEEELAET